jgi:hypothetical protein
MTNNPFTPRQESWRWWENNAAEPTSSHAFEDTIMTLADNSEVQRLRIVIEETGGDTSENNVDMGLEYDTDSGFSSPQSLGPSAHWNYYDGLGTQGNDTTTYLISNTDPGQATAHGQYYESEGGAGTEDIAKGDRYEMDFCIQATANASENTTYYFRVTINSTAVPLYVGATPAKTHPGITTTVWALPSSHTYFDTPQYSGTAHHVALSWTWNSGCYNSASGMRSTSSDGLNWDWAEVSSSHLYFYPSGSPTKWIWVSGSYAGGGQP